MCPTCYPPTLPLTFSSEVLTHTPWTSGNEERPSHRHIQSTPNVGPHQSLDQGYTTNQRLVPRVLNRQDLATPSETIKFQEGHMNRGTLQSGDSVYRSLTTCEELQGPLSFLWVSDS